MKNKDIEQKILEIVNQNDVRFKTADLYGMMDADKKRIDEALAALVAGGDIVMSAKGKIMLPEEMGIYKGVIDIKRGGFGFLRMPDNDIFIGKDRLSGAMHNDTVVVRQTRRADGGKVREGEVIRIVDTGPKTLIGTFDRNRNHTFVLPDQAGTEDIYIKKSGTGNAKNGQKVIVEITKRAVKGRSPEGVVKEVLGFPGEKGVDVLSAIKRFGIKTEFGKAALQQADQAADSGIQPEDLNGRKDFRKDTVFTIDGADAKDLDDAVSIRRLKNGNYLLGVHIADVTHYVKKGSVLDNEAMMRGTSVYLVDKVVPMLPESLSNGVCSLNEKVDRLTVSCEMEIDMNGNLVSHQLYRSVINSVHRMTYSDVNRILEDGDKTLTKQYRDIVEPLKMMQDLAKRLHSIRDQKGSIDFDIEEAHIKVDKNGKVTQIVPRERGTAERLIEEFMLTANKTVAEDFFWRELPFVYRVHEPPEGDKLTALSYFLSNFGFRLNVNKEMRPKTLQMVLNQIKGLPHENIINQVMLRSLQKAEYRPENLGHFGLAFKYYCHFTSPIRRYPDFTIHRIIKDVITGGINRQNMKQLEKETDEISKQSSLMERRAMEAERAVEDMKKCEYMLDKVGETYTGVVSGVANSALFVELDNTIEGVLPLANLTDDYYQYIDKMFCVIGERKKKRINLGDEIKVVVKDVNLREVRIEFDIVKDARA